MRGKRSVAACAIGNPGPFLAALRQATGAAVDEFIRPDHDPFSIPTVGALLNLAQSKAAAAVVVTAKDWSKLQRVKPDVWPCPVVVADLEMHFDRGWDGLRQALLAARVLTDPQD